MSWLAIDDNKEEWIYQEEPSRKYSFWKMQLSDVCIQLPSGSIQKLIGRELTWEDSPVEI